MLSRAFLYNQFKNSLGSLNSTLIYGINELRSWRGALSISLEFPRQSSIQMFGKILPPLLMGVSMYTYSKKHTCSEG